MMTLPDVDFRTKESILKSIEEVADTLAKKVVLTINDAYYRMIDFEFYVYAKGAFEDVHIHKHDIQLKSSKFYLHRSGVDITLGDGVNYGGILLRSIIKLSDGSQNDSGFVMKQTIGPRNVATELFSNLYPLDIGKPNEIALFKVNEFLQKNFYPEEKTIRAKRIGLTAKEADRDNFYKDLRLRYVVLLPQSIGFKQKIQDIENTVKEMLTTQELKPEDVESILGYNRKFL